jgi:hypothetical protein
MLSTQPQSICASHRCVWECIPTLGVRNRKVSYVATLSLGLQPKLMHENGNELGKCPKIQTHFHKYDIFKHIFTSMGKCHEDMQFETLPNEKHSRNYNFMRVLRQKCR